jgi:hypothetical protein
VCSSRGESRWISAQRDLTSAPMLGMQPAIAAATYSVQSGAAYRAHSSSAQMAATVTAIAKRTTRRWP